MLGLRSRDERRRRFVIEQLGETAAERRRCLALAADAMTSQAYRDERDPEPPRQVAAMMTRVRQLAVSIDIYLKELGELGPAR